MTSQLAPQPPYHLLFEVVDSEVPPLAVSVGERGAVPLFGSKAKAREFLESTGFEAEVVEVSVAGLVRALQSLRGKVEYVAIDPPPASEAGMRVEMGRLEELVEALEQSQREDDPLGLWRN